MTKEWAEFRIERFLGLVGTTIKWAAILTVGFVVLALIGLAVAIGQGI